MRRLRRFWWLPVLVALLVVGVTLANPLAQDVDPLFGYFDTETLLFDTRADLELLADEVFDGGRPDGWIGTTPEASATPSSDLWFDNELLATEVYGGVDRPEGWIGATSSYPEILVRNVRHDLEIAADSVFDGTTRPEFWRGADPVIRCDRSLLNFVTLINGLYEIVPTTPESVINYCVSVTAEVQQELLNVTGVAEQSDAITDAILAVRGDLERLADERFGVNERPEEWIGNRSRTSPTLIADTFLDLETLANIVYDGPTRPDDWIGGVTTSPLVSQRNLRHDLEILADAQLGANTRPNGWQGEDPVARCDPLLQDLVLVVEQAYETPIEVDPSVANFCDEFEVAVNLAAENPPRPDIVAVAEGDNRFLGQSEFAFAYLDVAARDYMGIMPGGTEFRAFYRNFGESSMIFVTGVDFALYIDYRFSTIPEEVFNSLPTLEQVNPITFCDAEWCNGPGPTPTPTGQGLLVLLAPTAPPPPSVEDVMEELETGEKTQYNWSTIRVTYIADNAETLLATVALEICASPSQIDCEPVLQVFNEATDAFVPVLTTAEGLNVYELPYGYNVDVIVESETRFSEDIWITDPTIRVEPE